MYLTLTARKIGLHTWIPLPRGVSTLELYIIDQIGERYLSSLIEAVRLDPTFMHLALRVQKLGLDTSSGGVKVPKVPKNHASTHEPYIINRIGKRHLSRLIEAVQSDPTFMHLTLTVQKSGLDTWIPLPEGSRYPNTMRQLLNHTT